MNPHRNGHTATSMRRCLHMEKKQQDREITHESAASYNRNDVYIGKTTGGWGEGVHEKVTENEVRPHLES